MGLTGLGDLLEKRFGNSIGHQITDAVLCDAFDEAVEEWWQGRFKAHVKAQFVRAGVLYVAVNHSVYAHEIKMREGELVSLLARKAGKQKVKSIVFTLMV